MLRIESVRGRVVRARLSCFAYDYAREGVGRSVINQTRGLEESYTVSAATSRGGGNSGRSG